MRKCYIAGKISGLTVENYTRLFEAAKKEVEALGFIPVCPIDLPHNHDKEWSSYMREDIREMLTCEAVFAISNWQYSRGAIIEIGLAKNIGMPVIYQTVQKIAWKKQ